MARAFEANSSPAVGTRMTLARAARTDGPGHNDCSSSTGSGQPGVTPFVCVHCTSTGQLFSCGLQVFLNWGAVRRHCQSGQLQNLNYLRATVTPALRPLAGPGLPNQGPPGQVTRKVRGGAAGPAPDVRHQPPGDADEQCSDSCLLSLSQRAVAPICFTRAP
jgi:hypothetical protein